MRLRSGVAVAVAWPSSYSSDLTPSLETSIRFRCGPKKQKKQKKKKYIDVNSHCGSAVMNPIRIHEDASLIPGLAQWVEDLATALIQPLAW